MATLPRSERVSRGKAPRPYAVVMDCDVVGEDLSRRVLTEVFRWSERYAGVFLSRTEREAEDASHPYSSMEIAESKLLQAISILTSAGADPVGISMRPVD